MVKEPSVQYGNRASKDVGEDSESLVIQAKVLQQVSINKPCLRFLQVFAVRFLPVSFENHSLLLT